MRYVIEVVNAIYTTPGQAWLTPEGAVTSKMGKAHVFDSPAVAEPWLTQAQAKYPDWKLQTVEKTPRLAHSEVTTSVTTDSLGWDVERTAIAVTPNRANSIDILDGQNRLVCRVNLFDHSEDYDTMSKLTVDVCLLDDRLKGTFLARVNGALAVNESPADCNVFTTYITPV